VAPLFGLVVLSASALGQSASEAQNVESFLNQIQIPSVNSDLTKEPTCTIQAYQLPTDFTGLQDAKWNTLGAASSLESQNREKEFVEIQYAEVTAFVLDEFEKHCKLITSASTVWGDDTKCSAEWDVPSPKSVKNRNKNRMQVLTVGQDRSRSKEKKYLSIDFVMTEYEMGDNALLPKDLRRTGVTTGIGIRGDLIALRFNGNGASSIVSIVKLSNNQTSAGVFQASANQANGVRSVGATTPQFGTLPPIIPLGSSAR
jgi:hypothetical protein